jgi:hypothetical protein
MVVTLGLITRTLYFGAVSSGVRTLTRRHRVVTLVKSTMSAGR